MEADGLLSEQRVCHFEFTDEGAVASARIHDAWSDTCSVDDLGQVLTVDYHTARALSRVPHPISTGRPTRMPDHVVNDMLQEAQEIIGEALGQLRESTQHDRTEEAEEQDPHEVHDAARHVVVRVTNNAVSAIEIDKQWVRQADLSMLEETLVEVLNMAEQQSPTGKESLVARLNRLTQRFQDRQGATS